MNVGELSIAEFGQALAGPGLRLAIGPFAVSIRYALHDLFAPTLQFLYGDFPLLPERTPAEFRIRLGRPMSLRRWFRPQVVFWLDDIEPFYPFPAALAFPLFEWGLNWCIYDHVHEFLVLHAAVVEKGGRALVMPAATGSGKSTLAAALVHRGWRLLSDEFALIGKSDGLVYPIPRPIGLKQASIPLIRQFAPGLQMGPSFIDTRKGTVAHLRPPADAVQRMIEPARPAWLVFPAFDAKLGGGLVSMSKASAFIAASGSSFNYRILGEAGFDHLSRLIDQCEAFDLPFNELAAAADALDRLGEARRNVA